MKKLLVIALSVMMVLSVCFAAMANPISEDYFGGMFGLSGQIFPTFGVSSWIPMWSINYTAARTWGNTSAYLRMDLGSLGFDWGWSSKLSDMLTVQFYKGNVDGYRGENGDQLFNYDKFDADDTEFVNMPGNALRFKAKGQLMPGLSYRAVWGADNNQYMFAGIYSNDMVKVSGGFGQFASLVWGGAIVLNPTSNLTVGGYVYNDGSLSWYGEAIADFQPIVAAASIDNAMVTKAQIDYYLTDELILTGKVTLDLDAASVFQSVDGKFTFGSSNYLNYVSANYNGTNISLGIGGKIDGANDWWANYTVGGALTFNCLISFW